MINTRLKRGGIKLLRNMAYFFLNNALLKRYSKNYMTIPDFRSACAFFFSLEKSVVLIRK
jgi:hypothetical protein